MPDLIVTYLDRAPDTYPLGRLRITIGRSARNDICISDPFASRVHAEVRREGDQYFLQDLGSANGTFYNHRHVEGVIPLTSGDLIQIGETKIEFKENTLLTAGQAALISMDAPATVPEATIAPKAGHRTTSGLLEAIEGARTHTGDQPRAASSTRMVEQTDLLALISKVGITLLASATLDETLRTVVNLVFESVPAERCLIMLRDEHDGELHPRVAQLREREGEVGEIRVSRNVIEEVVGQGRSVLTANAQQDPRFMSNTMMMQGVRSVLGVPLGVGERIFGLIYADSPLAESRFTEDHLKVLTTLGSVAAIRVENARLIEERLESERMNRELQLAREIQQRFQPAAPPTLRGYELQGISFPSYEIGGDYYDFIERRDGRMVIALGDVSGKGTAAALLMSSLHAAIHAQVSADQPLVETIAAVNNYLTENTPANRFVTLFYAELDPLTGSLSFINAGHNPPLIVHAAGTVEHLEAGGIPLGLMLNVDYRAGRIQLHPGDALVIYSDGVTETVNPQGEEFGPDRLYQTVLQHLKASAAGIRDRIESALTKFAQGAPAIDDITLVIVKRDP